MLILHCSHYTKAKFYDLYQRLDQLKPGGITQHIHYFWLLSKMASQISGKQSSCRVASSGPFLHLFFHITAQIFYCLNVVRCLRRVPQIVWNPQRCICTIIPWHICVIRRHCYANELWAGLIYTYENITSSLIIIRWYIEENAQHSISSSFLYDAFKSIAQAQNDFWSISKRCQRSNIGKSMNAAVRSLIDGLMKIENDDQGCVADFNRTPNVN